MMEQLTTGNNGIGNTFTLATFNKDHIKEDLRRAV